MADRQQHDTRTTRRLDCVTELPMRISVTQSGRRVVRVSGCLLSAIGNTPFSR